MEKNRKTDVVLEVAYLEAHVDLVSRLRILITRVTMWVIVAINLLTKYP